MTPINSQGYSFDLDIQHLTAMGVPRDKIVLGLMPGQYLLGALKNILASSLLKEKIDGTRQSQKLFLFQDD